jgi:hypothetical protein
VLGRDDTGRAIEIVLVTEGDRRLVIHAMDARRKFWAMIEEAENGTQA